MDKMYFLTEGSEQLALHVNQDRILDFELYRPREMTEIGAVYFGLIKYFDQSLGAYFVDIGLEELAYLDRRDVRSKPISEGQRIIVQVIRTPYLDKGARVTENLNFSNPILVYLPNDQGVNVSRKIDSPKRLEIKEALSPLIEDEGVVVRTHAETVDTNELITVLTKQKLAYKALVKRTNGSKKVSLLAPGTPFFEPLLNKMITTDIQVVCDSKAAKDQLLAHTPSLAKRCQINRQEALDILPLFEREIDRLSEVVISCDKGVTLTVEETEAMIVIDVNSSGYTSQTIQTNIALEVNKIAAEAIVNVLDRRNYAGMIVIDFIRMRKKSERDFLARTFESDLKATNQEVTLYGFSPLGLFEMTRKRGKTSPMYHLFDLTPKRKEKTLKTKVYQLERQLLRMKDEATVVEMSEAFFEAFQKLIDIEKLKEKLRARVTLVASEEDIDYNITRVGSTALIDDYLYNQDKRLY